MPFDALVAASGQVSISPLTERLVAEGVMPVSPAALEGHKFEQLERFSPSFWYRHPALLSAALLASGGAISLIVAAIEYAIGGSVFLALVFGLSWLAVVALAVGSGAIRLRSGAHWVERRIAEKALESLDVPENIATLARHVQSRMPDANLVLGELMREHIVLDPYLLLQHDDESVCLGIWDGDLVIACAARA